MDKEFKKNLTTTRVVILTAEVLIEGTIFHHQEIRLSDSLNAPQFRDNPYVTLAEAVVTKIDSDHVVFRSNVLMVARSRILCIAPRSEVKACGLPSLNGHASAANGKVEDPPLAAAPAKAGLPSPEFDQSEPVKQLDSKPTKEKRSTPRRKSNLHPVLITNGDPKAPAFDGWVVDRSAGGLRLLVKRPVKEGSLLSIRPIRAPMSSPWLKVEVRHSTTDNGNTNLGCRFVLRPTSEELQHFG